MFSYSLLTAHAVDVFEPIAKWATVGLLGAVLLVTLVLFFVKRTWLKAFIKPTVFAFVAYLLAVGVIFFALDIAKHYSDSYTTENWLDKKILLSHVLVPLLVLFAVTLLWLAVYALTKKQVVVIVGVCVSAVALVITLAMLSAYYDKKIANDGYYNSDVASVKQLALYIGAVLATAIIVGLSFFDKQKLQFDARALAYAGICVAMSFALSYIKLWDMPQGGSITLVSLLPVMLFAYMFGAKKGVFVGFVYGVLQAVQDPWLIHPAQFLLDYPVAFSAVGLAGLLRELRALDKAPQAKFAIGAVIAGTVRFICHVLSGALAFEAYAEGQNAWAYSLAYNLYVFVDVALAIVAGAFVLSSKSFVKTIEKINKPSERKAKAAQTETSETSV